MPSDRNAPRKGVFARIYGRNETRGGKARGGGDEDRARGRDATAARGAARARKDPEEDERDAELRMRADTMAIALRCSLGALSDSIDDLDDLLRDTLAKSADGMREAWQGFSATLDTLDKNGSLTDDLLGKLALLEPEIEELAEAVALALRELRSVPVKAAIEWSEGFLAGQLFPWVKAELTALGEALCEGYPVDLPAIARFCDTIDGAKTEAAAATLALATLLTERDTKLPAARQTLDWFAKGIGRPLAGPVIVAIQQVEAAKLDALTAATLPAAARAAIQRDIDALAVWAGVVDDGFRKDKYVGDILNACNDKFPFVTHDGSKPRLQSPKAMGDVLEAAVLDLPADAGGIAAALVAAKSCPGRWQFFVRKDEAFAEEQRLTGERDAAIALLSTHLRTDAGWGLGQAPADLLAGRMFAAKANALAMLQSSGLTEATWNLLAAQVGYAFETMAGIFVAITQLVNQPALALLATGRLPFRALSPGNLSTILASGAARLSAETSYSYAPPGYAETIGASVVIEWNGWMPGDAKAHAWGAVHFHFAGRNVATNVTVVHLKDYELHTAGGMGSVSMARNHAAAVAALVPIRARNFRLPD